MEFAELRKLKPKYNFDLTLGDFERLRDTAYGICVDVGTREGTSAYAMSLNATHVFTIDIQRLPHMFGERPNITFVQGESTEIAKQWKKEIDVLFIDASHDYDSVKNDIKAWTLLVKDGGWVMLHDFDLSSPGVMQASIEYVISVHTREIYWPREGVTSVLKVRHKKHA